MTVLSTRTGRTVGATVVTLGLLLALPLLTAQAIPRPGANGTEQCVGHFAIGAPSEGTNPLDYQFACPDKITGYAIVLNREVASFDANIQVFKADRSTLIPDDTFACEGALPGLGVTCNGTYSGGLEVVKGTLQMSKSVCAVGSRASAAATKTKSKKTKRKARKVSTAAKLTAQLVVTYASGAKSKTGDIVVTQAVAGPFNLPVYHGSCALA